MITLDFITALFYEIDEQAVINSTVDIRLSSQSRVGTYISVEES
jgi:hypothetical protein